MRNSFSTQEVLVRSALMLSMLGSSLLLTANFARADHFSNEVDTQVAQTDRWTTQVRRQLNQAALAAGFSGINQTHNPFIGSLGNRGVDDITLNLSRGVSYLIVGACDSDCRDLDLKLYDENGNLIASDTQRDYTPVVSIKPRWSGRFTIRVIMANCSNAPCRYGVGAFGK